MGEIRRIGAVAHLNKAKQIGDLVCSLNSAQHVTCEGQRLVFFLDGAEGKKEE